MRSGIEGQTITLNVLDNDVLGADGGAAGGAVVGVQTGANPLVTVPTNGNTVIQGIYGTLTLSADGTAVYKSTPNLVTTGPVTDTFTYTIRDADGDQSTTTVKFNLTDSGLKVTSDSTAQVFENALDTNPLPDGADLAPGTVTGSTPGSAAETVAGNLAGNTTGGVGGLTFTLQGGVNGTISGTFGVLHLDANGQYVYTLTSAPKTSPGANNGADVVAGETFTYEVKDSLGNTTTGNIKITIVDDVPTATADVRSGIEGQTITLNVLDNDVLGADGGAAGGAVVGVKVGVNPVTAVTPVTSGGSIVIQGVYGTLTLSANGTAVYKSTPNLVVDPTATETFTYTIRDGDGDQSTTTLTFNLTDSGPRVVSDAQLQVFENALDTNPLPDGADLAPGTVTGSTPGSAAETVTGNLAGNTTGGVGALTFTLQGANAGGNITGSFGILHLDANGQYAYTLTSAPKTTPVANNGANVVAGETFTYQVKDSVGNTTTGTIKVNIVDDIPTVVAGNQSLSSQQVDSNLLLVIDVSGSMAWDSGVPGKTRLQLAKDSINQLLTKYAAMGNVMVEVVTFSDGSSNVSGKWVTVAQAKLLVNALQPDSGTNYDAGIAGSKTAFATTGKLVGAQNVAYFFSDGEPNSGDAIGPADEASLKTFYQVNNINSYAIGLGTAATNLNLDPIAYNGSTKTDTNAVIVTDLSQLDAVLTGTVQAPKATGSLLDGGSFGADGGFIKTITIDGITYTYNPTGAGAVASTGLATLYSFDTVTNTLTVTTSKGGSFVIDLDTGEYVYTLTKVAATAFDETITFTVSDNDGDLAGSGLVIHVTPNAAPVAVTDNIITNILSQSITVPGDVLLANDTDPNGDPLTASPTTFQTLWGVKGSAFTGTAASADVTFNGTANTLANQAITLSRSAFQANTVAMTAALVVTGYLGDVTIANANDEDFINVSLKKGETLNLNHDLAAGRISMEYSLNGGNYVAISDGATFTASQTGTYQIHLTNIANTSGSNVNGIENYHLTMTIGYGSSTDNPDFSGTYTATDPSGSSSSAGVNIAYQAGTSLSGTAGDDVMLVGAGNNTVHGNGGNDVLSGGAGNNNFYGDAGNDLLFSGPGNDLLDGGSGVDTASYAHATTGVTVTLGQVSTQTGAGLDTLVAIENLIGSNYNDTLIGDTGANVINGGLGNDTLIGGLGNDTLIGGAGSDTFLWRQGEIGRDTVSDFTPGTDKLDLSQLLQGENASSASLDDYLHFKVTGSGASLVTTIDISAVAGSAPVQTIDLAGVNLATHYGVTPGAGGVIAGGADTATIINGMLNDHSLKVDTV